ncbi:MAG: 4Fe-4S binding protein, partial [Methanobacteriota archaeon]
PCSCTFLRALSEYGIQNSMAKTNFYAVVDKEACEGSKTCLTRCHFKAISVMDDVSSVNRQLCTGCGLCVITCPSKALSLVRKPEDEAVHTPKSLQEWNEERAKNRMS